MRNDLEALRWSEIARRLNGDLGRVEWIQARVHRRWNDFAAMDRHLVQALANDLPVRVAERERTLAAAQSGKLIDVEEAMQRYIAEPGDDVADIADAYAMGLSAYGRTKEAKVLLVVWAADCPFDPKPHLDLARIAKSQFRPEDAETGYRRAFEINPRYPAALFAMSQWHLDHKQPREALPLLDQCIKLDPESSPAANVLAASCHRLLGDRDTARGMLEGVLRCSQAKIEKAYLRLATRPTAGAAEYEMGMVEFEQQHYQPAAEYFRLAIDQAGEYDDAEYQLGRTLAQLGHKAAAQAMLDGVTERRERLAAMMPMALRIARDPEDFEARFQVGVLLLENGKIERGLFHLHSVLAISPQHADAHRRLAQYYAAHQDEQPHYAALAARHREFLDSISATKQADPQ